MTGFIPKMKVQRKGISHMNELGNKLSRKRKDLGMTQSAFADELNVTRQTVSRWEAGTVLPDIDKIADIADLLGVSCDYLLKDDVQEEETGITLSPVSSLVKKAEGRSVRLNFYDEEADYDLFNAVCKITAFEGSWMKVEAETKKGRIEKLIPVSSVLSVELMNEEE